MNDEVKKITEAEYQRLSEEACVGFEPTDEMEADEAELWLSVCQKVYSYLELPLEFSPMPGATQAQMYLWNLQNLVYQRRATKFDTLEIPSKLIYHILYENHPK